VTLSVAVSEAATWG